MYGILWLQRHVSSEIINNVCGVAPGQIEDLALSTPVGS